MNTFPKSELTEFVPGRWPAERINAWYAELPWLVGCNYYPATAINQIDMWQASTFDPATIETELALAASIGMNTLRVFLHDLVWADDAQGLYGRMDRFLKMCAQHAIRPSFVFFDDCHYSEPQLGPQPLPVKAWHNSGWVNCPARRLALRFAADQASAEEVRHLQGYVQATMNHFRDDQRVLYWELYNEPGRGVGDTAEIAGEDGSASTMGDQSRKLVRASWVWAREVHPSQPITSNTIGSVGEINIAINRANADLHSIHNYGSPEDLAKVIREYQADGRPVIVTEWLARELGSTVAACLPVMKRLGVGAINWGFVNGQAATIWPWPSRNRYDSAGRKLGVVELRQIGEVIRPGEPLPEPELWFHDLFRTDHRPYNLEEIAIFRELTGRSMTRSSNGFSNKRPV